MYFAKSASINEAPMCDFRITAAGPLIFAPFKEARHCDNEIEEAKSLGDTVSKTLNRKVAAPLA
jgi:hypothetical protein